MRILGIDPGCVVTGYGLVEEIKGRSLHIDNGGIFPPTKLAFGDRICFIHDRVEALLQLHSPDAVAIENIFVAKNVSSTLKLGHARGAAMVAVARAKLPLHEYTALQVKQAVTGYGHASKEQIQRMVKALLKLPGEAFADASDALAVALCHLSSYRMARKVKVG
ncbi:MAG TPA: crossover junction endodeoxyribonuclease RuvC [bacterium]|nr:crossover junction endodeoxyribonuclease RuvC [bacterium]